MRRLKPGDRGRLLLWCLAGFVGLGTAGIVITVLATGGSGLDALVLETGREAGPPLHVERDPVPTTSSVERLEPRGPQGRATIRWNGFLYCPTTREYRLGVFAAGRVRLRIDGRTVVDREPTPAPLETSAVTSLGAGSHALTLEYDRAGGAPNLELRWDVGNVHRLVEIPATSLSLRPLGLWAWRLLRTLPAVAVAILASWAALMLYAGARLVRRWLLAGDDGLTTGAKRVIAGAAVLFAVGIWWGLPGGAWAPDEIDPASVLGAVEQRFAGGWFDRYPPGHYVLLSLVYLPVLVFKELGWIHAASSLITGALFFAGRLLTVAMATTLLAVVAVLTRRVLGAEYAWRSTLLAALFLPLPFYAKTVNLDVPYTMWFAISLIFLTRAHGSGRARDVIGFGITAGLAIGTKDQAYGLYVLPAPYLAWTLLRRPGGFGPLLSGALAGTVTLALCHNLVGNLDGVRAHFTLITTAIRQYRMYPSTLSGDIRLFGDAGLEFLRALGWPGTALLALGLAQARRYPPWLWLAPCSYLLTFLAPVGYVQDRFLLPIVILAALPAAAGLHQLQALVPSRPAVARALSGALIVWLGWRAVSLDALLVFDSRYRAEAWLQAHVPPGAIVASVDEFGYLPRLDRFRHRQIRPTQKDTLAVDPAFIVVNTEFVLRFPKTADLRTWLAWLDSGASPYREVFRYKTRQAWSSFGWDARFTDRIEEPRSNLDKANPEIAVYKRVDDAVR